MFGQASFTIRSKKTRQGGPNPAMGKVVKPLMGSSAVWQVEVELLLYQTKVGTLCTEHTSSVSEVQC